MQVYSTASVPARKLKTRWPAVMSLALQVATGSGSGSASGSTVVLLLVRAHSSSTSSTTTDTLALPVGHWQAMPVVLPLPVAA